ncbi:hypothetical protein CWS31_014115 [Colwellia echini]|uniref:Lipoprotein n=1 Tax=Colwellia echini TaxID=1982103 RepID=A0ABY3MUH9_9GAMM|nr:hypothetical protein CWS31_014115 [Colwellia echini]
MQGRHKRLPIILILLISACKPESGLVNIDAQLQPQCITSQSQCEISTTAGTFIVQFSQSMPNSKLTDNIKTELPFTIEVSSRTPEGNVLQSISKISGYLEGKDMFMGKVPVFFEKQAGNNNYVATSLLASCSEEQMVWRLWLTVNSAGAEQRFFVDFMSQRL